MVIVLLPANMITVVAFTGTQYDDYLYYQIESNGEVTITDCKDSATKVEIPAKINGKSVTAIGKSAFYNCEDLTSVTIPDSIIEIGSTAFYGCHDLENVYISNIESWCNISFSSYNANPLLYGGNLYVDNNLLTNVVIPNKILKINDYAFYGCGSITSVTIPNGVTSIGNCVFDSCSSLTSI